jgi:hypothetical protein
MFEGIVALLCGLIVVITVLRATTMTRWTPELDRWSTITLAVGAFWKLGCSLDYALDQRFADLTLLTGVALTLIAAFLGACGALDRRGAARPPACKLVKKNPPVLPEDSEHA